MFHGSLIRESANVINGAGFRTIFSAITCSNLKIETLEQGVKYVES